MTLKKTLTIAGSDTSAGAGMQADLKAFQEHGTYGMVALTVVVTMDPNGWHHQVTPLPTDLLQQQIDTALSTKVDAIKTGMLSTEGIIKIASDAIQKSGTDIVVIDPVMVCKGDDEVLNPGNTTAMIEYLLPYATVVTPNLFEAGQLAGTGTPKTIEEMKAAAAKIHELGAKNVVIKGGKALASDKAVDLFYDSNSYKLLASEKVESTHNHGAGCTFAASVCANLANGLSVEESVIEAKEFVSAAIAHGWALNEHVGPVMHGAKSRFGAPEVTITEI
ncbi:bifunctional hydroxymethylpyrimidine kinase/phosphomethylpyrimidine kinase [Metasolibacillus sp.]|uniref:bifunctional hydroxymethylpyrimidine kinase/phosphomethylpyrimidine kinase n=1 Tax=Metasolibacillus sp. TaxID=2703680 RepID=UPI0025E18637|nr:bifunctional hydroxymethylpyrimidine kinase/phosphomethylpyrimidine kinase [Metasolibacillus sp.]MCT6923497.1 bifunctional hydroxymethylpyrimidine kinase/phosphomethylpyrimidine kinase [Metasolibacillus sp.]MCT6939781.1 bifunctional hydroxymethylpyrimidine kinase/phosphomethylpyrimidine kinase [Metasolibacillus sp.]